MSKKVCLDPGHGIETAGKRSPDGSYRECEFALDMAFRIKALLERHGVAVTLTRSDEHDVSLAQRVRTANAIKGLDLFVSLHSNAAGNGTQWMSARGLEVYTSGGSASKPRNKAARAILARQAEAGVTVRNNAQPVPQNLYVLRNTTAPACLVEHLFHDNREDTALLKDADYRQRMAEADAKGILDYLGVAWVEPGKNFCVVAAPLSRVKKIAVVFATGRSMAQVKADTGCDWIINGGLYDLATKKPYCHLKADGVVKASDQWGYVGLGWDIGPDIHELEIPRDGATVQNYVACVNLLGSKMSVGDKPIYTAALAGTRGRTAIALKGDNLLLYCSKDGGVCAGTPEELQRELADKGATFALMLDGGASSQCDFGGDQRVVGGRDVAYYICVWLGADKQETKPTGAPEAADPWAADAWERARAAGVLDGTRPHDYISRQELAVVMDRLRLLEGGKG